MASVQVTPLTAPIQVHTTLQLTAIPKDSAGVALNGRGITWSSNAAAVASVNGSGLVTGLSPGPVTITATSEGRSGSAFITVTPGPATQLAFTAVPSTGTAGTVMAPPFRVTARDAYGNTATDYTGSVTVAIATNPGGGVLAGTSTAAAVGGIATFSNLSIDKSGPGYTLQATSGSLATATSAAFSVTSGAAAQLVFTVAPSLSGAGAAITPAVQVTALDAFGNTASGFSGDVTVAISTNPTGGTLSGTTTRAASSGIATFSDLSIDKVGAGYALGATSGTLTAAASTAFAIIPGSASASQSALSISPGAITASDGTSASTITVTARDAFDNPIPGAVVVLSATGTGNTLTQPAGPTDANGVVTGTLSSTRAESKTVSATMDGVGITQTATVTVGPAAASTLGFTVQPSTTGAGNPITPAVVVTARDAFGNTATGFSDDVTLEFGDNPGNGTLAGTNPVTPVSGVATFSDLSIDRSGIGYTLTASASGPSAVTSSAFNITVGGVSASQSTVSGAPASIPASNGSIASTVTITAKDGLGNPIQGATVVLAATGAGNLLTQPSSTTDADGLASGTLSSTVAEAKTVSATIDGVPITQTATVTVLAAGVSASQSTVAAAPTTITASSGSSAATITVTAKDAFGNPIPGATVALAATGSGNTLTQPGSSDANGMATGTVSSTVAEAKTVSATIGGVAISQTAPVTVNPGATSVLVFSGQPTTTTAGATITSVAGDVQVRAQDAFGNVTTTYTGSVTVNIGANPGDGTLLGTTTVTAVAGVATFSDLIIDEVGVGYTLQATSDGLTPAASATFDIFAAGADHLAFTVEPSSATSGASISPPIRVEIQDPFNNRVTTVIAGITLAFGNNPGGGTLSGTTTQTTNNGVASFPGLSIDKAGIGYTLQATLGSVTPATSAGFDITAGAADHVAFLVQPSDETAGATINPALQVEILDASGNRVTNATHNITVAIVDNPGGGALSGTKTVAAVGGIATFSSLSIDKAGTGYTLAASASGLAAALSDEFSITPGSANRLAFFVQPSNAAAGAAIAPAVKVEIQDAYGNRVGIAVNDISVAIADNPAGGTLSGIQTSGAVGGVATFSNLSIDNAGTGYTLGATASGLTPTTSAVFNIVPGPATQLVFTVQPSGTSAGATISPPVQVTALDAQGNTATGFTSNVTVAIAANPSGGTLSGTRVVSAVAGVATFSTLSIDKAGTGYKLRATRSGLTPDTSVAFSITAGSASQLVFTVQPTNTVAGATLTPSVQVIARDAQGNTATGFSADVSLAIAANPGGGTLSGTTTVPAVAGVATFATLSVDKVGAGYTLRAAAGGLAPDTSATFTITAGPAARLEFSVHPSNTAAGAPIAPAVLVEIQDALGNRVATDTRSVTVALGANPGGGTLAGTTTVNAVAGAATFADLGINNASSGYTLTASATGVSGAISNAFDIVVGTATKVAFLVQPTNTAGGATIAPPVQVEIQDAGGNRVTTAGNSVTLAIGDNPGGGALSGTATRTASSGVASFTGLSVDKAGSGYTLDATTTGLVGATSSAFSITVGPPAQLGFSTQPSTTTAGVAMSPTVQVEIRDAGGNLVTSASNSVTMAIGTNPAGGTLSGTTTRAASGGVASFNDLRIDKAGTGYALGASATGLTGAASILFTITAGPPSAVASTVVAATDTIGQCLASCVVGIDASTITVTVKDQFGNVVDGSAVVLSATGSGNTFSPASGSTNGSGVFTAAFNAAEVEAKTISATAGGTTITQTALVHIMPVLVGAGDIADCNSVRDDATANLLDGIAGTVFAAGDNVYPYGRTQDFANCYEPTWGRHKARTRPVVGNHEYDSSGTAAPYFAYFGTSIADPLGNGFGYYSFDLGAWHVVVLNSDSGITNPGSGQLAWLQSDLVGRTNQCVLALWHRPLFTSGSSGGKLSTRPLWQALQNAGAEIIINGHDHLYERFALQDSLGNANPAGIREFIVGTGGGESHSNYVNNPPNVEASDAGNFSRGVLKLTLYASSYRWQFIAAGQGSYSDSGTASCH